MPLLERTVNLKIEEAYPKLKAALVEKGCRVLSEESPKQICFRQGSLWGVLPKTAKKIVKISLQPSDDGARISCSSRLASDWKNNPDRLCIRVSPCVFMRMDGCRLKHSIEYAKVQFLELVSYGW